MTHGKRDKTHERATTHGKRGNDPRRGKRGNDQMEADEGSASGQQRLRVHERNPCNEGRRQLGYQFRDQPNACNCLAQNGYKMEHFKMEEKWGSKWSLAQTHLAAF